MIKTFFTYADSIRNITDKKAFRVLILSLILNLLMIGNDIVDIGKQYIPIAFHKWFKTEVMETTQEPTMVNSDLPNEEHIIKVME